MLRRLTIVCLLVIVALPASFAQGSVDTLRVDLYFRHSSTELDPEHRGNGARLEEFLARIHALAQDPAQKLERLQVIGSASPDGSAVYNRILSTQRVQSIRRWAEAQVLLAGLPIEEHSMGVDWQGLVPLVEASSISRKNSVLQVLRSYDLSKDFTEEETARITEAIQAVDQSRTWNLLLRDYLPQLRGSGIVAFLAARQEPPVQDPVQAPEPPTQALEDTATVQEPVTEPAPVVEPAPAVEPVPQEVALPAQPAPQKEWFLAAKTNLLVDLALVPNVGVEYYLGKGWSVGASWMYSWWTKDPSHFYWRTYGGELAARKYFGAQAQDKPLSGHHAGLYATGFTYDFETGGRGYLSYFTFGAGLEYGYSFPLKDRLHLDLNVGLGYLGGKYKVYDPEDGCYVWKETRRLGWFGPSKAEVSLVWLIGNGWNTYSQKGRR